MVSSRLGARFASESASSLTVVVGEKTSGWPTGASRNSPAPKSATAATRVVIAIPEMASRSRGPRTRPIWDRDDSSASGTARHWHPRSESLEPSVRPVAPSCVEATTTPGMRRAAGSSRHFRDRRLGGVLRRQLVRQREARDLLRNRQPIRRRPCSPSQKPPNPVFEPITP